MRMLPYPIHLVGPLKPLAVIHKTVAADHSWHRTGHRNETKSVKQLAILLAVFYLTLVSIATYCVTSHETQHSPLTHPSKNHISHSSLCFWACQVSSKADAAQIIQRAIPSLALLLIGTIFLPSIIPLQRFLFLTYARGPPH